MGRKRKMVPSSTESVNLNVGYVCGIFFNTSVGILKHSLDKEKVNEAKIVVSLAND